MTTGYELAYRLGLTPWERAGEGLAPELTRLLEHAEAGRTPPFGAALDIGCGTGGHSIELAQRGWQVTGIDTVSRALDRARTRAPEADLDVRFMAADATRLEETAGSGYRLLFDLGCFHGLKPDQRADYARGASAITEPDATLLMFAFGPGHRGPLPRGASEAELVATFAGWQLTDSEPADTSGMPGPLKSAAPKWYRFTRRASNTSTPPPPAP